MAKRQAGRPGPGYDGPAYDPVYGPPFDSSLGGPVTPPLVRRTPPPNPRRTQIIVVAVLLAVLVVVATVVLAVRLTGDQRAAVAPSPAVSDVPKGQSERLIQNLTANGFRCSAQFSTGVGARRGCFTTRADTILAGAIFEDDPTGTVTAVRLTAQDLSNSSVLRARTLAVADDLVELFGPVVFPDDQARAAAGLRKRSATIKGTWGAFRLANSGDSAEVRADKTGRTALTAVTPVFMTQRKDLEAALTKTGWRCVTACTKAGQWVNTTIRLDGPAAMTGIWMVVTGTGTLDTTRDGFHAQVRNLIGLLDGDGVPALEAWLDDQRDRGSGSEYVAGWRVWVEARYAGERPAGYQLRLSTEPTLAPAG